ncbi:MAG: hypothetical protein K2X26_09215 [Chitinophagaceae bacterium]|nr:hypothetical protein [Chitinophagaceae bacterium]
MVRLISLKLAQNKEGKDFISIQLQGGVEAIQSQQTGKMYLTARTAWIPTTFDEKTAESLIGSTLPGEIRKVPCEPYEYTIKETGEVVQLAYSFEYLPEGAIPEVNGQPVAQVMSAFS